MKSSFATTWKSSVQPRKQRKYVYNAPIHTRGKFLGARLTRELQEKYSTRSFRVITGDKVKVLRGSHKGKEGTVEKVDSKNTKVFVTKIDIAKPDGSKRLLPIHPSNVMITELNLKDKKRKAKLESFKKE